MTSRLLSKVEKRIVLDALRAHANEARKAKSAALVDPRHLCSPKAAAHVDELARRAGTADRLAAEINDLDVRLEKVVS